MFSDLESALKEMCLKVFVNGDDILYERLKAPAARLDSAFQKVFEQ
jgi:hypothetical protein